MRDSRIPRVTYTGERGGGFEGEQIYDYNLFLKGRERPLPLYIEYEWPEGVDEYLKLPGNIVDNHI